MKQFFFILLSFAILSACTKKNDTPEGPSDIRISNISASDFEEVYIDIGTDEGEHEFTFGSIANHSISEYHRFEKAYPKSLINVKIAGRSYTTGVPDNTYAVVLGKGRFTLKVWIESGNKLNSEIVVDGELNDN